MYRKKSYARYFSMILVDFICIYISMVMAFCLRYGVDERLISLINSAYFFKLVILAIFVHVFLVLSFGKDKNTFKRGYFMEMLVVLRNNILMFAGITAILYMLKLGTVYARMAIFYFLLIDCGLMYVSHQFIKHIVPYLYRFFGDMNLVLIMTDSENAENVINDLNSSKDFTTKYIGVVFADGSDYQEYQGLPVVSTMAKIVDYCQIGYVDEVVVATAKTLRKETKPIMDAISEMGITVHYYVPIPELTGAKNKSLHKAGSHYMVTYATRFVSDWEMILKRIIDIAGGLVGCVFLLIFTIIVGPLIKLESPGPIFFAQKRVGRNGRYFKMYKFRSMYADAEQRKKELMKDNEMDGLMFKMEDDPRITKIGKFIRKTSIDEFPQFWNVLKGDMSLVGTRPPTLDEFANYSPYHKKRLSFRPGITGLWQASGRNDISDFEQVVSLDVEYIDNWSVLLDIKILFMTVFAMFSGK